MGRMEGETKGLDRWYTDKSESEEPCVILCATFGALIKTLFPVHRELIVSLVIARVGRDSFRIISSPCRVRYLCK